MIGVIFKMDNYTKINLVKIFNHKAILKYKEEMNLISLENRGLGPTAEFYLYQEKDNIKSDGIILIENIPFAFPDISINSYDNIECNEQIIPVRKQIYNKVHFLGLSIYGNHMGKAMLKYDNGNCEEIDVSLYGWGFAAFNKKESSGFKFIDEIFENREKAVLFGRNTNDYNVSFTYWAESIEKNNILSEIQLPDNSFMHILAITLQSTSES